MAGHDRDRAEFAHRARVAEQNASRAAPSGHWAASRARKVCQPLAPSDSAASSSAFPDLLHQRDQFARDEREGDEHRREHHARQREDDLDVVAASHGPNKPCAPNSSTKTRPRDHRRDRERQVDERIRTLLPRKVEFGDRPGRADAEDRVERHDDGRDRSASDGSPRARPVRSERRDRSARRLRKASVDDDRERQQEEQREERDGQADQSRSRTAARIARRAAGRPRSTRVRHGRTSRAPSLRGLIASSIANEIASMIAAIAVAPA